MYDDHYSHPSNYYRGRNDDRSPERGDRKRKSKSRERSPGSSNYKKRRYDEEREDYRGGGGGGGYYSSSSSNYRRSEGNRRDDNRRGSYNNRGNNRNSRGGNNNRYSAGSNKGRSSYGTSNVDIYEGPLKPFELYKQSLDDYLSYEELQRKFREYVEEYMRRCAQKFYRDHREEEWFKERYHPNNLNQSHQSLLETIKNRANKFIEDNANNTLQVPPLDVERFLEFYQQHHAEEYNRSQQIKDVETYEEEAGPTDSVLKPDPSIQAVVGDTDAVHYSPFPPHTLFIATVHPNLYKEEIYNFLNSVEESPLLSLTLSKPTNKRGWTRQGWASYSTQEQAENAMRVLNEKEIKQGYKLTLVPYAEKVRAFRQTLAIFRSPERIPKDIKQCQDLIGKLDEMRELYIDNSNPVLERKQEESDTNYLDRLIHYLRTVHLFCYYSLKEFTDENELNFQCGKYYLRSKSSEEEVANAKRILEAFDKRFESKKNRFREPNVFTGKKAKEDSNNTFFRENFSELTKEKFKCKICAKAFKAVNYIEKHIYTKHSEEMDKEVERAIDKLFLENYLSDYERPNITPQRAPSPPPPSFSSGNSSHQSQRTPRNSHKNKQYHYQEEEDEEDELDTRMPSDYLDLDHSVNGVPSLDYYLGIFNK